MHICGGGAAIGGVRQYLWCLAPHLERLGLRVEIAFLGEGAALAETRERGIAASAVRKRGRGDLLAIPRLARLMRARRPAIVHTHTLSTNFYGRFAAMLARVPRCVTTVHSFMRDLLRHDPTGRFGNQLLYWQNQYVNRFADRLIAVSQGVQDWLLSSNVPPERIRLIRCGMDLDGGKEIEGSAEEARQRLGLSTTDWVIGNIARTHPVKDQMTLLEATIPLMQTDSSVKLVIVGDGPERPRLDARCRSAGVAKQVRLPGRVSNARTLMPGFDVYVLSSRMEGVPLSILEAMAARRPVVATWVGGIPEVVEDGLSGLLVPEGSPESLREAVGRIRADQALARRLAGAGRRTVEQTYDARETSRELADVYEELLRGSPERPPADAAE
jgi:glycosyltransferase involved in cell wall biosynthesis